MALRSIEEVNAEQNKRLAEARHYMENGYPTGVQCPECPGELWNKSPGYVNASNPPTIWATCELCKERVVLPEWVRRRE